MPGRKVLVDDRLRKVYLVSSMDDASRLITLSTFCPAETALEVQGVLKLAPLKGGLPTRLVIDNGSTYRAATMQAVCEPLGKAPSLNLIANCRCKRRSAATEVAFAAVLSVKGPWLRETAKDLVVITVIMCTTRSFGLCCKMQAQSLYGMGTTKKCEAFLPRCAKSPALNW